MKLGDGGSRCKKGHESSFMPKRYLVRHRHLKRRRYWVAVRHENVYAEMRNVRRPQEYPVNVVVHPGKRERHRKPRDGERTEPLRASIAEPGCP